MEILDKQDTIRIDLKQVCMMAILRQNNHMIRVLLLMDIFGLWLDNLSSGAKLRVRENHASQVTFSFIVLGN